MEAAVVKQYRSILVGVAKGENAQHVFSRVKPGDRIDLRREPANPYDRLAVAGYHNGRHIGYIPRDRRWVQEAIDEGKNLAAAVEAVESAGVMPPTAVRIRVTFLPGTASMSVDDEFEIDETDNPLVEAFASELQILGMLAHADGDASDEELELIGKYVALRAEDSGVAFTEDDIEDAMHWAFMSGISPEEFDDHGLPPLTEDAAAALAEVIFILPEIDGDTTNDERAFALKVGRAIVDLVKSGRFHV